MNPPNEHAKQIDEQALDDSVTHALRTLGSGTPPSGMEQRILTNLQREIANRPAANPASSRFTPQLWLAGGLAAACLLAGVVLLRPATQTSKPQAHQPEHEIAASISPTQNPDPAVAPRFHARSSPMSQPTQITISSASRRVRPVSTAHLVSFPAPPQPLTRQEQLLLALAQNPSPEIVAALDPIQRAQAVAREQQQFRESFNSNNSTATTGDTQ